MIKPIVIVGKNCGVAAGHYLARSKGWGFKCELYCDGVNWFFADHNFGNPDVPKLFPLKDGIELIDIEINSWKPIHFSCEKEKKVPFNQIDWYA